MLEDSSMEDDRAHARGPNRLILVGVGMMLVGAILVLVTNAVVDALLIGATEPGQAFREALSLAVQVLREVLIPLGAAFVGAGIVVSALRFSNQEWGYKHG